MTKRTAEREGAGAGLDGGATSLRGFGKLFAKELGTWTGTRMRWLQPAIWLAVVVGPITLPLYLMRDLFLAEAEGILPVAIEMFTGIAALGPAIGAIVLMQGSIIAERQLGTAAWILSKPVSRTAFYLAKLTAHGAALLVAAVAIPGLVAYAMLSGETSGVFPVAPFLAAMGMTALNVAFYLSLTLALGAFTSSRGVVVAVPLALLLGGDLILNFAPDLAQAMPWILGRFGSLMAQGRDLPSVMPVIATAVWVVVFTVAGVYRFRREDL